MIRKLDLLGIQQPLPERLYKITKRIHLDGVLSGKSLWVGTLYDFMNCEKHGLNKGDELENSVMYGRPAEPAVFSRSVGGNVFINGKTSGPGAPIVASGLNFYVYCLSLACDEAVAKDLDADYDTCIEIETPAQFLQALTNSICQMPRYEPPEAGYPSGFAKIVTYKDREFTIDASEEQPDPFIKRPKFADQKEYRLVVPCYDDARPGQVAINMAGVRMHEIKGWR